MDLSTNLQRIEADMEDNEIQKLNIDDAATNRMIEEEVLKAKIRKLIDEPKPDSVFKKFSSNPLTTIFLGFLLTVVAGAAITSYFGLKQKEFEHKLNVEQEEKKRIQDRLDKLVEQQRNDILKIQDHSYEERQKDFAFQRELLQKQTEQNRGFSNELNKTRIEKIAEVWQKIYEFEAAYQLATSKYDLLLEKTFKRLGGSLPILIDREFDKSLFESFTDKAADTNEVNDLFNSSTILQKSLIDSLSKNRFWLGEEYYRKINDYIGLSISYMESLKDIIEDPDLFLFRKVRNGLEYIKQKDIAEKEKKRKFREREKARLTIIAIRNKLLAE